MIQSTTTIGLTPGKLRAIAGDHFITLPMKVTKSNVASVLDSDDILKAGTLITKDGKAVTTTAGTPAATNAYGVVYEDISFKNAKSADGNAANATQVASVFVHGVLYESAVKFSADSVAGGKDAEKSALKQILFI